MSYIKLFILLAITFYLSSISSFGADDRRIDSLMKVAESLPHDTSRLAILTHIVEREQKGENLPKYAKMLLDEANRQKQWNYCAIAVYFKIAHDYNTLRQLDSISALLPVLEDYSKKANEWEYYLEAASWQINLLTYYEHYELAINNAQLLAEKAIDKKNSRGIVMAYHAMANTYMATKRWKEAIVALEKAHEELPNIHSKAIHNTILTSLVRVTFNNEDYPSFLTYLKEQNKLLDSMVADAPSFKNLYRGYYCQLNVYYALYYAKQKDSVNTLAYLKKADNYYYDDMYFFYKSAYENAYIEYYKLRGEYNKALVKANALVDTLIQMESLNYISALYNKASILALMGRADEAYPIYKNMHYIIDSLDNQNSGAQMNLIKDTYYKDKVTLDAEVAISRMQNLILFIVIIAICIVGYYLRRIIKTRKALRESEEQTREATRIAAESNEIKDRFMSNLSANIRNPLTQMVDLTQQIAEDPGMQEEIKAGKLTIIQKNTGLIMNLVTDVLDLSRLESKMSKFAPVPASITSICTDATYMAKDSDLEVVIEGDNNGNEDILIKIEVGKFTQAVSSTLKRPNTDIPWNKTIKYSIEKDETGTMAVIKITNSPLVSPQFKCQEVYIRHEINRLLIEHFGGTYKHVDEDTEETYIVFTCPIYTGEIEVA